MPNKLNIFERGSSLYGRGVPFFVALNFLEFGKNANSARLSVAKGFSSFDFNSFGDNWSLCFSVFSPKNKNLLRRKKMKKFLSILLLVSILSTAFSACNRSPDVEDEKNTSQNSTEESTDAPNTENKNNGNSVIFTVTEEEWATALNLLLNDNYIHTTDASYENTTINSRVEKNGNNIKLISQQMENSLVQYWTVQNGQYRLHEKQDTNVTSTYWNYQFEYHSIFLYEDFEYDEKTNAYLSDKVIYNATGLGTEMTFLNLSFQFENGKLVKLSYTQAMKLGETEQMEFIYTETITYGTASEIILPELD